MIGCGAVKARVRPTLIVELEVAADRGAGLADAVVGAQIDLLVFDAAPQPLTNTLSRQAPLPSILMAMPWPTSALVKAAPVNCEP